MSKDLIKAYIITINDLEIALRTCGLFNFKRRRELENLIKEYEFAIEEIRSVKKC